MNIPALREAFTYDPATGVFTHARRASRAVRIGAVAGTVANNGYVALTLHRRRYSAHRVAWAFAHDEEPSQWIDHINGVRTDNRIANLRLATPSQSGGNKNLVGASGVKGVTWSKKYGRWQSSIYSDGRLKWLGYFDTKEEAADVYRQQAAKQWGEFAFHISRAKETA